MQVWPDQLLASCPLCLLRKVKILVPPIFSKVAQFIQILNKYQNMGTQREFNRLSQFTGSSILAESQRSNSPQWTSVWSSRFLTPLAPLGAHHLWSETIFAHFNQSADFTFLSEWVILIKLTSNQNLLNVEGKALKITCYQKIPWGSKKYRIVALTRVTIQKINFLSKGHST